MDIITRAEAKEKQLPKYFTGEPCRNGHIDERITSTAKCCQCKREAEMRWYNKNREDVLEYRADLRQQERHRAYIKKYGELYRTNKAEAIRQYNQEHKEQAAEWAKQYRKTLRGKVVSILANIKDRAKRLGLEFDLTHDDIIIPETCPVLGIPINPTAERMSDNSPSVDRIDNTKGYIKGNVCVISMRANRLKSDSSIEEMALILEYMETNQRKTPSHL